MKQVFRNAFRGSAFDASTPYKHTSVGDVSKAGTMISNHMKKHYNPKEGVFRPSDQGRNLNNLWSGYELGGKGNIAVTGSLLGGGAIIASNPRHYQDMYNRSASVQYESEQSDIESLQSTRGDMQGYQVPLGTDASQMLKTSGDLVFAMHKTRHSGQF